MSDIEDLQELKDLEESLLDAMFAGKHFDDDLLEEIDDYEITPTPLGVAVVMVIRRFATLKRDLSKILDIHDNSLEAAISEEELGQFRQDEDFQDKEKVLLRYKLVSRHYDQIISYFMFSSVVIEALTIEILQRELIAEEYQDSNGTQSLLSYRLSQESRNHLLLRTGIISNSLHSNLEQVRKHRGSLAHRIQESILLANFESISEEIDRTNDVVNELYANLLDDGEEMEISIHHVDDSRI